ncbi:diaminopimelate epimerase [Thiomicrorhabdus immobilis]|uniref:Diaminopimelate epimerase n=1 Tax=Thiomicrorhabdus immobilis TaxID=2791037 RepID=A0ABM7MBG8_9GAMM|nr:diaminopimelate epimerase [Thiomicrorhabdus immobilis]BCN92669.1 diaminopimelate epimerase [Thiomicrorhabdus immobilis]
MSVQSIDTGVVQPTIKFTKMQGLGNDFMVIDAIHQSVEFSVDKIQLWSDRHFGIGFDQLLVVEQASQAGVDFRYRIFNADGSEVQQCGNGARCFARFVYDKGLTDKTEIKVETASGVIVLYIEAQGLVRVNMGLPNFEPSSLPFLAYSRQDEYALSVLGETLLIGAVSMGNPHAVLPVDDINSAPVEKFGAAIESHSSFPERVNVGFAQRVDRNHIRLRVYERGAAETLACGTGACAAMVVLRQWQQVDDDVTVSLPGGDLLIQWNGQAGSPVWMSGPAVTVFEGEI